jgi:hypothetical protein
MVFVIQYVDRPNDPSGNAMGGYLVNDGHNTVFISTGTPNNRGKLFEYVGNGDKAKGRDMVRDCISMPSFTINARQYNGMVCDIPTDEQRVFKGNH